MDKTTLLIGGGVIGVLGISQVLALRRMERELIVDVRPSLQLPPTVRVTVRNPTQGSVSMVHPQVAIYTSEQALKNRTPILVSDANSRQIRINRFGQAEFDITFRARLQQLPSIIRDIRGASEVIIQTTSTLMILGGLIKVPYSKTDKVRIG
jgi:hypothetical protein